MQRAKLLKTTEEERNEVHYDNCQKISVKYGSLDINKFRTLLPDPWSLLQCNSDEIQINELCRNIDEVLYNVSVESKCNRQQSVNNNNENRWKWLLEQNEMRKIWMSINWKGTFDNTLSETPSDLEKAKYFRDLFKKNANDQRNDDDDDDEDDVRNSVYIPILDDPVTKTELSDSLKQMALHGVMVAF